MTTPIIGNSHRFRESSCIVCGAATDKVLAALGEAEAHVAFWEVLGVPEQKALHLFEASEGLAPNRVPTGVFIHYTTVCAGCVAASPIADKIPKPFRRMPGEEVDLIQLPGPE